MSDLLESALNPRSVAVIGASENIHKIGGRPIHYMRQHGFGGRIYPINPAREEVQGLKSYASLAALPEAPDLAMVVVGGEKAVEAVAQCAARGVKSAVVVASGFGETGEEGRAVQRAMVDTARAAGMRLYGPNTQGLANFGTGAIAGFSTMFVEVPPADGPVGIVSQSGGMSAMAYGLLRGRGLGVRHVHATGNEADITVSDLAWAVAHDPDVKLLLLYLENIANPELLARTAAYARERDLPIIAVKAGRSESGQKAASSHTGSLANEDRTVDAFFRHHGIWRVRDPHAQALAAEAYLKGWRPEGRRLVIISNSGASCVMGADASEEFALPLAELAPATRAEVASRLPGFATADNPIDITAALLSNSGLFGDVLPAVAQDPAADLFLINIPVAGAGYDVDAFARDTAAFERSTGKPVVVAAWQDSVAAPFRAQGIPTYANENDALGTLAQLASHTALMRKPVVAWPAGTAPALPAGEGRFLNEAQSLAVLAAAGVPVVAHRLCRSARQAAEALAAVGAPAVVKACSGDVPHKSEHGLVALNVATAADAAALFERQWAKLAELGAAQEGVIVAAMRRGQREFMVGARIDPVFGPVVVVGDGGKYVEALQDVAVLLPPFAAADVTAALRTLRIAPLLEGVRGDPPLDVDALAAVAVAVGLLIVAAGGAIASIDVNPVLVAARGEGAVVVDALIERGG
ncbi:MULTISPECIES: acetate--CoA ligase family protein [unclassified Variovorax]|uniref:acetate--CoA ligase family protein n=1 Tax=unclassified Variovorax TaxID=663243 RepID=UPI002575D6E5|nr:MULTISPECIES: acetate--CoA ligase family protein [unclassified Variovorax]MDM0086927.1 acetate--CoA ligase family protein [Variovorax sp. J22G40]MDM0144816.1 acetate--CoA ligase family protein [Variovorax sp. J2P1-31]